MIDSATFRRVLGHYPTGVCVITAVDPENGPVALVVGTFTSVSLDPPLVGFLPVKGSYSWAQIERAGRFCVNVLGSDQKALCGQLASKGAEKFDGVEYDMTGNGSPLLKDVIAWIDCDIDQVVDAGDHYFVLGRVLEMDTGREQSPMLFFQGKYGEFAPTN